MADRLELAFRRRAPELLNLHPRWLVAVSGGADSIALLHLVTRWFGKQATDRLVVAHLDHGLRRGSKTDRRFVERSARQLGLPFVSDRLEAGCFAMRLCCQRRREDGCKGQGEG